MKRTLILVALVGLLAITMTALAASAQTPYGGSGDWIVQDTTTISNQAVTVSGDVIVTGTGHLTLTNVNLRFSGVDRVLTVSNSARLTMSGGSVSALGSTYAFTLNGRSQIEFVDFTSTKGITTTNWRCVIANCTIRSPSGTAITINPTNAYPPSPLNPLVVRDNNITDPADYGILATLSSFGDTDIRITVENNSITSALRDGIRVTTTSSEKGRYFLRDNHVWLSASYGIYLNLNVRVIEIRLDGCYVKNNTMDGLRLILNSNIQHMRTMDYITAIGNGGTGVYIDFTDRHWQRPIFKHWYIEENEGGGIDFRNFQCATVSDSYNVNEGSPADYSVVNTVLEVFRTTHRKGQARVSGSAYHVTSYRYLNLNAVWQNGMPCRSNTVEFEDTSGERLFYYTTDYDGWLGNHTEWDWRITSTRSNIRGQITAFMIGGSQRLPGPGIEFDKDLVGNLVFSDSQTPDLTVEQPSANHVQNHENLTIAGKCFDAHSGSKLVQVSFDPEPTWNRKAWYNASGTSDWDISFDPWPDGVLTVFVRAFDNANWPNGIFANITINNVTIDTTAPNLTVIQPPVYWITNQSQITVLGTTDADVVSLTINGEFLAFYGGTFNKPMQLNEGNNTLVIVATDFAGNIAKDLRYIVLDSIAPILYVSYPPDGLRTNEQSLTMGGFTDVEGVDMKVGGVPVQVTGGTWSHTITLLKGPNTIIIDAVDIADNHRIVTISVFYDPDPPAINVNNPSPGEVINTSMFSLLGSTDPDIRHNQIEINGIFIGVTSGVFDHEMTVVDDGPLNITIVAIDLAGNVNSKMIPVFIDTTAPDVKNINVPDGDIVNTFTLTVTGETEDDARLFVGGNIVQIVDGMFNTQVHLDEGDNIIIFRVTDQAGNTRDIRRYVTLDTQPPTLFLDNIIGNITRTTSRFITVTGNTEGTFHLTVTVGDLKEEVFVNPAGEFSHPIIIGKNRTTVVVIEAVDYAGNLNQMEFTIKKQDVEKPGYFEENPEVGWGIIALVVVLAIAYPVTRYGLDIAYQKRIKVMGVGPQQQAQAPPPQAQAPPRGPPRPPAPGESATPRPPRPEEGAPRAPPRPPSQGE
jgi:hypothetical protein